MAATKEAPNLLTYQYNKATSTGLNRQRGSKDSSGLLAALLSQIIPPQQHPVTIAIIETLRSRKKACQRSSHYLSAIYRSQREREWGGGTQTQRHETVIFEVHLQSTGFSSSQSLWAISSCNNLHLSLLVLSEWPNIEPQDLSACLPACLSSHPSVTDQLLCSKLWIHFTT